MAINPEKFQESITRELEVVKDRVRNLIGSAHWGEEGRYKEAVLSNVLKRFLPSNLSVGTGFVVKNLDDSSPAGRIKVSKQIDVIIYDNTIPLLFSEGDFIIASTQQIKAIIEVKTKKTSHALQETIKTSMENAKLIGSDVFVGIFIFERDNSNSMANLKKKIEEIQDVEKPVDTISIGPHVFIKHWPPGTPRFINITGCETDFYGLYDFGAEIPRKDLSFSYFISNLITSVSEFTMKDRLWLLFPVRRGKESYRYETAEIKMKK